MSKSLYELLATIASYKEFSDLANASQKIDTKKYYLEMRKSNLLLIDKMASIIGIDIKNPLDFYEENKEYTKENHFVLTAINRINNLGRS